MSASADQAALLRAALRAGCRVLRKDRHIVLLTPGGRRVAMSVSPSDCNAVKNMRRDLERAGVVLAP